MVLLSAVEITEFTKVFQNILRHCVSPGTRSRSWAHFTPVHMRRLIRKLRNRWNLVWSKPSTRLTFIIVGTALGVGAHFYPIIKAMVSPPQHLTEEQISYYDKDNYYPIKVRKQREQEKLEMRQQQEG